MNRFFEFCSTRTWYCLLSYTVTFLLNQDYKYRITVGNNLELSYKVIFLLNWDYKYQITIGNNLELAYKVVFLLAQNYKYRITVVNDLGKGLKCPTQVGNEGFQLKKGVKMFKLNGKWGFLAQQKGQNALHKWEMRVSGLTKGSKCSTQVRNEGFQLTKRVKMLYTSGK